MRRYSPTSALTGQLILFVAALATIPGTAQVHTHAVMVSYEQLPIHYASSVKRLPSAVVKTLTRKDASKRSPSLLFGSPIFRTFLREEPVSFGQRELRMARSLGSGVVMNPDSLVKTNNHVIASSTQAIGPFNNLRTPEAEIVHTDKRTDLAALKVGVGEEMLTVEAFT